MTHIDVPPDLHARALAWPFRDRLMKVGEESAELAAAVCRYRSNPSEAMRMRVAEEIVGVLVTIGNVAPEMNDAVQAMMNSQMARFVDALERSGL
jgi:hypothetical protein